MAKGKKKSAKTPLLIVVLVLLIIVFAGLCVFYFGLKKKYPWLIVADIFGVYTIIDCDCEGSFFDNTVLLLKLLDK